MGDNSETGPVKPGSDGGNVYFWKAIGNKAGVSCILEYKLMSDVMDQYLLRARLKVENQYVSYKCPQ